MKVSTKGRYALRMMVDLGRYGSEKYVPLRQIAERQEISLKYLEQIALNLSKSGLIKSMKGPAGGYALLKEPKDYTAGEIIRVLEGDLVPVNCLEADENPCPRNERCPVLDFWEGLGKVISDYIDSTSLLDLIKTDLNLNPNQ